MNKQPPLSLLEQICRDAVKLQEAYDEAFTRDLTRFTHDLPVLEQLFGDGASALAPARLTFASFQVKTRVSVARQKETGFGLGLSFGPLNLAYEIRTGRAVHEQSELCLSIEAVPLNQHSNDS